MQHDFRVEILECQRRAAWYRQKAEDAVLPRITADFLALEWKWLVLAGNYEFIQQLSGFILGHDPRSFRRGAANGRHEAHAETL